MVDNQGANLFFHQDKEHIYKFDESSLASGGLYGLLRKRKGDLNKKITRSKLVPLQTVVNFRDHVRRIGDIVYQRRGRSNRVKKINHYVVELCIIALCIPS